MTKKTAKKAKKCDLKLDLPDLSTLEVIGADIRKGKQDDPAWCPIALAVRRKWSKLADLSVEVCAGEIDVSGTLPVRICTGKTQHTATVEVKLNASSKSIGKFVLAFDTDRGVKPVTLRLKPAVDLAFDR